MRKQLPPAVPHRKNSQNVDIWADQHKGHGRDHNQGERCSIFFTNQQANTPTTGDESIYVAFHNPLRERTPGENLRRSSRILAKWTNLVQIVLQRDWGKRSGQLVNFWILFITKA